MQTTLKIISLSLFAAALFLTPRPTSAATVSIDWVNPERFSDVAETATRSDRERSMILNYLEQHFVRESLGRLSEGQVLRLSVTDVDLAGEFEPWRSPRLHDVRYVRSIYPARLRFTWQLTGADGALLSEGEERLSSFDTYLHPIQANRDRYPYIKEIYRRWLNRTF